MNYPASYQDEFGEETTLIGNDGSVLEMKVRGIVFTGHMLDDWTPDCDAQGLKKQFCLLHGCLCAYRIKFDMPVVVVSFGEEMLGVLAVELEVGQPTEKGGVNCESLQLTLAVSGVEFPARENQGWFDDALNDIGDRLPEQTYIKCCHSCAYSDYSPAGYGVFGCLACFRNCKQEYLALRGKTAYFSLTDKMAGFVQETYLCPEFVLRVPGTGYRG